MRRKKADETGRRNSVRLPSLRGSPTVSVALEGKKTVIPGGAAAESEAEIRALAEVFSPVRTSVMSSDEYLAVIG